MVYDFFFRTFFRHRLWFRLFYWAVSRYTRNTKGKSPDPCGCVRRWGKSTGGRWVYRGFRHDLAPVGTIRFNVVKIWCDFAEKGGCEGGHGCMCQGGGPRVSGGLWLVLSYWWRRRPPRSTCPQPRLQVPPSGSVGWSNFVKSTHAMFFFLFSPVRGTSILIRTWGTFCSSQILYI